MDERFKNKLKILETKTYEALQISREKDQVWICNNSPLNIVDYSLFKRIETKHVLDFRFFICRLLICKHNEISWIWEIKIIFLIHHIA